ncbi:MAG: histidine phosphatase family protein [Alsobacter sp.]
MPTVFFVTHPEVAVDPSVPVPRWGLSPRGRERMAAYARTPEVARLASVWSSAETKAVEAAAILADPLGLSPGIDEDLHENDRSATGFLPPPEFEQVANAFFASPEESVRGWERAIDAQARVAAAVERVLAASPAGDVAIVAHGGVGTLLLCRLLGEPIDRGRDQPFQGHVFAFDKASRRVLHPWRSIAPR